MVMNRRKHKTPKRQDTKPQKKRNPNREYKRKIKSLVKRAENGDVRAETELRKELDKNNTARWVLKHMIKIKKSRRAKLGDASPAIRSKGSIQKGNAFKPYQGGIPSLGKKK